MYTERQCAQKNRKGGYWGEVISPVHILKEDNFLKGNINTLPWASLVAQWLRICLPMQGTRVQALVWEDPTCRGATKPVSHNY